uniref:DDE Tnp4 domain-containing protein n=1 Tax=Leptobrachium leishanense TaxID=445787 RepID=A0A8C5PC79_9ANUR
MYKKRYLATGQSLVSLHYAFMIGQSTASNIIRETCCALWDILHDVVMKKPNKEEWMAIADVFAKTCNFPNCLGALDGKHIRINKPKGSGSRFFNYKKQGGKPAQRAVYCGYTAPAHGYIAPQLLDIAPQLLDIAPQLLDIAPTAPGYCPHSSWILVPTARGFWSPQLVDFGPHSSWILPPSSWILPPSSWILPPSSWILPPQLGDIAPPARGYCPPSSWILPPQLVDIAPSPALMDICPSSDMGRLFECSIGIRTAAP